MDEIEKKDFNLNISRYVSTTKSEEQINIHDVHNKLVDIEKDIEQATDKHNQYLAELGLPLLPTGAPKGHFITLTLI